MNNLTELASQTQLIHSKVVINLLIFVALL